MSELDNLLAYYRKNLGISEEQEEQMLQQMKTEREQNPQGIHKQVNLLETEIKTSLELAEKQAEIRKRIDSGEITATTFNDLSIEEQELTKLVLFKDYSPSNLDIPKALSAIEFMLTSTLKFLDKAIDKTKLTAEELATWDYLISVMDKSDMPVNTSTDWRYSYLDNEFTSVQNNRNAYFTEKQNVTGSI